jgi:hypothetical protein
MELNFFLLIIKIFITISLSIPRNRTRPVHFQLVSRKYSNHLENKKRFTRFCFLYYSRNFLETAEKAPQSKKLFWNADGTTNLPEWKADVVQATKGAYGIYSVCLIKLKIPDEWIDEFAMPSGREWAALIDPEKRLFDIKLAQ